MNSLPGLSLGCILKRLPDCFRTPHPIVNIELAYAYGYADRIWPRAEAVGLAMLASFQGSESRGSGNKAKNREGEIRQRLLAEVYAKIDENEHRLSPADINRMAAEAEEMHTEGRKPRTIPNPHD
jgi:hypothetical protein